MLVDDNPQTGGQIWRGGPNAHLPGAAVSLKTKVHNQSDVHILTGARVVNVIGEHTLLLETADDNFGIRYKQLILCTGARERLLPFPGWTLPGVTGAGGLQALIKGGYDIDCERVVISGSGPLLLATAHAVEAAGAHVSRIAEQASARSLMRFAGHLGRWPSKLRQSLTLANRHYRWGTYVTEALGEHRLEAVRLRCATGKQYTVPCDRLACGYGLVPNTELGMLLGCATQNERISVDARQATSQPDIFAAGECTGVGGSELARAEGRIAALQATGTTSIDNATRAKWQAFADMLACTFRLNHELRNLATPETIICRCEDIPRHALDGETGWTVAKLEQRCGMGACQGRICGPAAQFLYGWSRSQPRAPITPALIDTLAHAAAPDACSDQGD